MPLQQKDINQKIATNKMQSFGCKNGLVLTIEPTHKGGKKYFYGRMRFAGKQIQIRLGRAGREMGDFSLETAMNKWLMIKLWSKENHRDPRDYFRKLKVEKYTLLDAINGFLSECEGAIRDTTLREYKYKLNNQVLSELEGSTPLKDFEEINGGRQIVMRAINQIEEGGKFDLGHRCRKLLCQTFDYAISQGWMLNGQNPATRLSNERRKHTGKHHPAISWTEVPELLKAVNLNKPNSQIQTVLATKLLLMTFLRAGALVRLEWQMLQEKDDLLIIDGTTSGLKRRRGFNDNIPHYVPLTKEIKRLLDKAKEYQSSEKYIFAPLRESRWDHLDPSAPNNFLEALGYRNKLRAHGWRRTALTAGIDELKGDREVIRRQMGHLPEGKVLKAYDGSLLMDERREFLDKWCSALVEKGLEV
tara:strand:- start:576 stop:1826 length:1251 start_codon:yes stop_codon:yes gene_type:complete